MRCLHIHGNTLFSGASDCKVPPRAPRTPTPTLILNPNPTPNPNPDPNSDPNQLKLCDLKSEP